MANDHAVLRSASIVAIVLGVILLVVAGSAYAQGKSLKAALISGALAIVVGGLCYLTMRGKSEP